MTAFGLRGGISQRFWLLVSGLLTVLLLASGGVEAWLAYRESVDVAKRVQATEARAAAIRIAEYLAAIESQVRDVARLPWGSAGFGDADRREEFHRLMKLVPAVFEVRSIDASGRERVYASRVDGDRLGAAIDRSGDAHVAEARDRAVAYSRAYFRNGTQPYVSLAVADNGERTSAVTTAELDLALVADVVQGIRVGKAGKAYVVDANNRLLAHPDLSLVLRNLDLGSNMIVRDARRALQIEGAGTVFTEFGRSPEGGEVLASAVAISAPDWIVLVEQSTDEALAPVRATLVRTLTLLAVGLAVAAVASLVLARRLTRPILDMQRGAARIGAGDLDARIDVKTGDEIEALAREFNTMAARLRDSYTGLEAKIDARTRELGEAGEKVRQQAAQLVVLNTALSEQLTEISAKREEADRANAAKTRFLASASHDLRQPMHAISLLVGILREHLARPDAPLLVEKVQLSVAAMENLFTSLLDISKLDAGAVKPAVREFGIATVLRSLELSAAPLAVEKGLRLDIRPCADVVRSDPHLLERILVNLVSNAIRYTDRGRVLVVCRRRGAFLELLVLDTGIGVPLEHLDDVFEEFFQVANPERDRSKGLGLGLSIVKRTAELLGHRLIVRSRVGKGSMFGVAVPWVGVHVGAASAATSPPLETRLSGAFVVVIDDDGESRFAMATLFEQWHCHVVRAASAAEALTELERHLRAPDLVVSDYRLRDRLTGLDAITQLRSATGEALPALIVTGDVDAPELKGALDGSTIVLHKPVDPDELRRIAEALLADTPSVR